MNRVDFIKGRILVYPETLSLRQDLKARFDDRAFQGKKISEAVTFPPEPLVFHDLLDWWPDAGWEFSSSAVEWMKDFEDSSEERAKIAGLKNAPCPIARSKDLRDFQRVGAMWLIAIGRGILGDEMGIGKTPQAVTAAQQHPGPVLIACPDYVKPHWAAHLEDWAPDEEVYVLAKGNRKQKEELLEIDAKYYIVNHEMLRLAKDPGKQMFRELFKKKWDVVILDEAHRFHNRKAQQSEGAEQLAHHCEELYLLTGTPVWNRPDTLWHLLHLIDPQRFSSYWRFVNQFCHVEDTIWARVVHGPDPEELDRLRWVIAPYLLRRTKKEVLKDLPDKIHETITYDLPPKQRKLYDQLEKDLQLKVDDVTVDYSGMLAAMVDLRKVCNNPEFVGADMESSKIGVLLDLVDDVLAEHDKLVIFTWHKDFAKYLQKKLEAHGAGSYIPLATGEQDTESRMQIVKDFRTSDQNVLIGTIASMGTGIDLYEASVCIFAEMDWTPAMNVQAEDRLHRYGQKTSPLIIRLVARDTIEERILETTELKADIATETLAIDEILKSMRERR